MKLCQYVFQCYQLLFISLCQIKIGSINLVNTPHINDRANQSESRGFCHCFDRHLWDNINMMVSVRFSYITVDKCRNIWTAWKEIGKHNLYRQTNSSGWLRKFSLWRQVNLCDGTCISRSGLVFLHWQPSLRYRFEVSSKSNKSIK